MKAKPKHLVSVVMAVYNGESNLVEAIESILSQSYKEIEFVIIDDGSTDSTASIIKGFEDRRIKYIYQQNQGLASALNKGIELSAGKYIARMDADDISLPTRIEKQVNYLENNRDIYLLGSSFNIIDKDGNIIDVSYHLNRPQDIDIEIFVRNPFGHGTVMIRSSVFDEVGKYDKSQPIEDYELWWRICSKYKASNLPDRLYNWRVISTGISHGSSEKRQRPIHELLIKIWQDELPHISISYIKDGMSHYSVLGDKYLEQFKYMLAAFCMSAFRIGKRKYFVILFTKMLIVDPSLRYIIKDMQNNQLSHNYLLKLIRKN